VAQPYELSETTRIASYSVRFGCEVLGATGSGSAFNRSDGFLARLRSKWAAN
jgi:hypothetical protein